MDRRQAEVAVIGAGLAGLAAARQLRGAGREVVVLEARDRVGGRTLNADIGGGKVAELGAQWVGPTQDRVLKLISELDLETFPTYTAGKNVFERIRADRLEVEARRAIIAVPPALAARIAYDPPLPAVRDGLSQRMAQGSVVKCMAVYERPFWRERGLSGAATSVTGPVSVAFDNSPPEGAPGVLLGFLEGQAARRFADRPQEERRRAVTECFTQFFGPEAAEPVDYVDRAWGADEWARGCYGGFMGPGAWTDHGRALREPIGPLHWAGAETALVWNGYMDGAVGSGQDAARAVLAALS